jgi:hypothetical protein
MYFASTSKTGKMVMVGAVGASIRARSLGRWQWQRGRQAGRQAGWNRGRRTGSSGKRDAPARNEQTTSKKKRRRRTRLV